MVRGRRVRAVVTCPRNDDDCCSPMLKRKDDKLAKSTITEFFQAVCDNIDMKPLLDGKQKQILGDLDEGAEVFGEIIYNNTPDKRQLGQICAMDSPLTPHRIELHHSTDLEKNNKLEDSKPKVQKKLQMEPKSKKVTDFFPVRRSVRKTKKTVLEERQRNLEMALRTGQEDGLEIRVFEGKGRGICATKTFFKGDFVVEYAGDLIDTIEAKNREENYALDQNFGCYMYYFKHGEQSYCIDATAETGRLGRLVNHSRNGNLSTRTIMLDNKPRLVLLAKEDIQAGQEVLYDYGDRSRESLKHHPWLAY